MTATSAEDPDWLERNASLIEDLRRNGKLSDSEDRAFSAIIEAGRSGHWQQAREQAFALGRAQRATNEDRKKTELRTITKDG